MGSRLKIYRATVMRYEVEAALMGCVAQWQRVAAKTIQNYETITDTSLCPVHLSAEQDQWIAGHKDPAFAERPCLCRADKGSSYP